MLEGMTHDEAVEYVAAISNATGRAHDDLMALHPSELMPLAASERAAAEPTEQTGWDRFLRVLGYIVQVAGPIATIASAFTGAFGAATAAKSL
jgi:hypothetical protein